MPAAAHSTRPGGWVVPQAGLGAVRHEHDFQAAAVPSPDSFQLVFPQLGNGEVEATGESFQTLVAAVNFSNQPANCRLSFFGDDGLPLRVPVDGSSASSLDFELGIGQQRQFETSGEGELLVGWALLESDQPVGGAVVFGQREATGAVVTEVGVPPAQTGSEFTILADSLGDTRTAIAFANPAQEALRISAELLDAQGRTLASGEIDLEPRGHRADFLDELFQEVGGIEEFLGSIRLRSPDGAEFAAMTLRSVRNLLTSLPTVAPPPPDSTRTRLAFPHLADGGQAGLSITTAFVLFNTTEIASRVTLDFFRSDGDPMTVEIDGVTASSFEFELQPRGVLKVETQGRGQLQTGWARASMGQPLSGSAIFRVFREADASRILETEVGVLASLLYQDLRVLADTRGALNTGLALANVDPDQSGVSASLRMQLHDADGRLLERTARELPASGHLALFVDQLFPGRDFEDFTGFLSVERILGPPVAAVALRSAGAKLTSTPTLVPTLGFAPLIEITPLQNLAGTRPGFSWVLHQNNRDLALRGLAIDIAGVTLRDDLALDPGDEIGIGYFVATAGSRTFSFLVREIAPDRLAFDTVVADPDGAVPGGSGFIRQQAGHVEIEWSLTDPQPFSRTAGNIDHHFFLFPGVLEAPTEAGAVEAETELTSVSSSPAGDNPAILRTVQSLEFAEPEADRGNIEAVTPLLVLPAARVRFAGSNLGDSPTITFPLQNGETSSVTAYRNGDGLLEARAPVGVANGLIFADNGNGPGNGYRIQTLFSPVADLYFGKDASASASGTASVGDLIFTIRQRARQLALSHFSVEADRTEVVFEQLTVGQPAGTGMVQGEFGAISIALRVSSAQGDQATIDVLQANQEDIKIAELVMNQVADTDPPRLRFEYRPLEIALDTVILGGFPVDLQLRLEGMPVRLPSDDLARARFAIFSTPMLAGLTESALEVRQFTPFLIREGEL